MTFYKFVKLARAMLGAYFDDDVAPVGVRDLRGTGLEATLDGIFWQADRVLAVNLGLPDRRIAKALAHELAHVMVYDAGNPTADEGDHGPQFEATLQRFLSIAEPMLILRNCGSRTRRRQAAAHRGKDCPAQIQHGTTE
jgi:predicted aminopeptidase